MYAIIFCINKSGYTSSVVLESYHYNCIIYKKNAKFLCKKNQTFHKKII